MTLGLEIVAVTDEGLGHSAHLIAVDGEVLLIDPFLVVGRYLDTIERNGWRLRWTADTHLHADYVSGGPELSARGATFFAPGEAALEIPHRPLADGDDIDIAGLTLRALPTPGHTPDHLCFLLLDAGSPLALFSGGSLMVGTVGRPDLFGPDHTDELARAMYRSLRDQLLVLPDDLVVHPTHGAGSFCSAPGSEGQSTTIGQERATNPLLQVGDEDEFVHRLVSSLGTFPTYYRSLPELNRHQLGTTPQAPLRQLLVGDVQQLISAGAEVIDVRDVASYAAAHVPGSLSNALRPAFASWLGWLTTRDRPLVFVCHTHTDRAELVGQCANIGYDNLAGELEDGIDAWRAANQPVATTRLIEAASARHPIIDVRQRNEYLDGHIPGAVNIELGVVERAPLESPDSVTVMCGHGERAASAASLLERRGIDTRIAIGGPTDWSDSTGRPLEVAT
ncbi:MAG TPA: MBL fold metallo-hydrolase [Acidimicrobiales bacterium]|nr:MBL fold metallo-hydrolase [Acidimicrobiales bacterium]